MSHTYVSELVHIVFSTKERAHTVGPEIQERLWSFLGGIARKNEFKALAVGGTSNHVHMLISLPATMPLAKAVQLLKGGSSKWLNDIVTPRFEWQQGYGAFSVGISQENATIKYINSQEEHHRSHNFEDEFLAFLPATISSTTADTFWVEGSRPYGTWSWLAAPGAEAPGYWQSFLRNDGERWLPAGRVQSASNGVTPFCLEGVSLHKESSCKSEFQSYSRNVPCCRSPEALP